MSGGPRPPGPVDPLEPLRQALHRAAHEEAAQVLARADETARAIVAQARREAELIREQARAAGAAQAAEVVAVQRARVGREARSLVLAAQRAEYDALRAAARAAVARLRIEPEYPAVRARMVARLRELLGPQAQIIDDPGGGVMAIGPGRSADFTLARLADRAVDVVLAEEAP